MATDTPFYMWTLVEAWEWLINVPVLGFIFLLAVGAVTVAFLLALNAPFQS